MPLLQMEIWVRLEMISEPHYVWNVCLLQYGILVSASSKISFWYTVQAKTLCIHGSLPCFHVHLFCMLWEISGSRSARYHEEKTSSFEELKISNVSNYISKAIKTWHQKIHKENSFEFKSVYQFASTYKIDKVDPCSHFVKLRQGSGKDRQVIFWVYCWPGPVHLWH